MKICYENIGLSNENEQEIRRLLAIKTPYSDDLQRMGFLLDVVWDEFGCNNKHIDDDKLAKFYSHPVWILNGLFIEQHELSMQHRNGISQWVADNKLQSVIDYGGGFGTLARLIHQKSPETDVVVFEPHISDFSRKRLLGIKSVQAISGIDKQYNCLIAEDVLEHVPNPIQLLSLMISYVEPNGYLIIANNFYPVIKCHLPATFHLRYTFDRIATAMGLQNCGAVKGAPYTTIYRKHDHNSTISNKIILMEYGSKLLFPLLDKVLI
jgi:2-polyprenyl-6-hydroxyphenyl methylase/3-demethylubiquinone-9 3-methyltransferase